LEDLVVNETMNIVMDDKSIEAIVSMVMDLQERESYQPSLIRATITGSQYRHQKIFSMQFSKSYPIKKGILKNSKPTKRYISNQDCQRESYPYRSQREFVKLLYRFLSWMCGSRHTLKLLKNTIINAIFLYDDKMLITFNHKDGTKTITFEEYGSELDCPGAPLKKPSTFVGGLCSMDSHPHMSHRTSV
jgi:hypothetical protein